MPQVQLQALNLGARRVPNPWKKKCEMQRWVDSFNRLAENADCLRRSLNHSYINQSVYFFVDSNKRIMHFTRSSASKHLSIWRERGWPLEVNWYIAFFQRIHLSSHIHDNTCGCKSPEISIHLPNTWKTWILKINQRIQQ